MQKLFLSVIFIFGFINIAFSQLSNPVVLVSGKALNQKTMEMVDASIIYEILPEGKKAGNASTNPDNGEYKIVLPSGKKYGILALSEGFYGITQFIDLSKLDKYAELKDQNLYLAPIEIDQVVRLNNIFFDKNSKHIKTESYAELNRFLQFLLLNKKIEIEIASHTDNVGNSANNLKLSQERANEIAKYLIENGINESRLTVVGYGDSKPISFNSSDDGREMNMRIEFKVLSLVKTKK